jgi:HD superfamily phosphohydrolase
LNKQEIGGKMQKKSREQVFRDPVYGYVHVDYEFITKLINASVFQRLRRIKQLSGVSMVFHTAEHSRFAHSLGVYELANRFIKIPAIKEALSEREQLLFLTTALLHDIGHGPYSHAFEVAFGVDHEKIGAKLIMSNQEVRSILDGIDNEFAKDVVSIILKEGKYPLIEQLVSSQLDIDRLDYLERDAHFTGAAYGHIDLDRLLGVVAVKDHKRVFKESGVHAIENYLVSRYHMYWQVYYHPKARAYEAVLEKLYIRLRELLLSDYQFESNMNPLKAILIDPNNVEAFEKIDDFYINGLISSFRDASDAVLKALSNDFLDRKLWKVIKVTPDTKEQIKTIKQHLNAKQLKYFTANSQMTQTTYVANEAEIKILTKNGSIERLSDYSLIVKGLIGSGFKSEKFFIYRDHE